MITLIVKRNVSPKEIQLTQLNLVKEMWKINGAEMLLEDSWATGIAKVRTPFFCLLEGDCIVSHDYLVNLLRALIDNGHNPEKGSGGYTKLAMIYSLVAVNDGDNLILGYELDGTEVYPARQRLSRKIGPVIGSALRMASVKDAPVDWDDKNPVSLSAQLSSYLWETNRRLEVSADTTYISTSKSLLDSCYFEVSPRAREIFSKEGL